MLNLSDYQTDEPPLSWAIILGERTVFAATTSQKRAKEIVRALRHYQGEAV